MMGLLIVRIVALASGLGVTELGLVIALGREQALGWLALGFGLLLLVAGSAGFMRPLLARPTDDGGEK